MAQQVSLIWIFLAEIVHLGVNFFLFWWFFILLDSFLTNWYLHTKHTLLLATKPFNLETPGKDLDRIDLGYWWECMVLKIKFL